MLVNSANCAAYCVVNEAGMCCTRITAAGKSRVKPGAKRITVAGPPVDAARTTTGKRCSEYDAAGRLAGAGGGAIDRPSAFLISDATREALRTTRTFAARRTLRNKSSR